MSYHKHNKASATKKCLNKEKYLTINTIKLNFVKKTRSMLYPAKKN